MFRRLLAVLVTLGIILAAGWFGYSTLAVKDAKERRPDPEPRWPVGAARLRQLGMLATLVAYPLVLEVLGFPIATALGVVAMAVLLGGPRKAAAISAVAVSLGLFVMFDQILGLHLPMLPSFR